MINLLKRTIITCNHITQCMIQVDPTVRLLFRIARIFEHDAKIKYSFPKIFIGLYIHVCLVVATTLEITKVYDFPNHALCWEWPWLFGKIWLSPPYKANGGLSRFSDEFWWPSPAYSLLQKPKCVGNADVSLQQT